MPVEILVSVTVTWLLGSHRYFLLIYSIFLNMYLYIWPCQVVAYGLGVSDPRLNQAAALGVLNLDSDHQGSP